MSDRSLRGMRLGAQSMETEAGVEPAARQRVEYRCEDGEQVFVIMAAEADIPATWMSKTGKVAKLVNGEAEPAVTNEKPVRTHWDMLLERRSMEELDTILKDRLAKLRAARGAAKAAAEAAAKS
ncbi:RNA polymerase-binding protein RbpA [Paeniglutamicibacter antarcticus]|uniref:RNA polymerase-binding protein RbpA n=1 Tax=Paeniglutamicibacter antarcticus TaxID=494023 RepID=A0ABP9TUG6_9MICC